MVMRKPEMLKFAVEGAASVSALLQIPDGAKLLYVLAHGAGVGMSHRSMETVAAGLAERGIATFRYNFPYMENGSKRPDPPKLCHATVRAALAAAADREPALRLIAGGRSFGGRMASQAHALSPLAGVRGLAFLGFPLHPAGKPSTERAAHLFEVKIPMLFLQGTKDALADLSLLEPLIAKLGARATLKLFEAADHSFHVPARSGRKDAEVMAELLDALAEWAEGVVGGDAPHPPFR